MCQDWGMDVTMGALLLAAFFSINILSLVYLAMIAIGMAVPAQPRRMIWRFCVLPLLAILLIAQYSVFIGLPPPFELNSIFRGTSNGDEGWGKRRHHDSDAHSDAVKVCYALVQSSNRKLRRSMKSRQSNAVHA